MAKWKLSTETKEKMRQAKLGKPKSAETRRRMSIAHKGKKHSEATKEKMKSAKKIAKLENPWA